MEVLVLGMGCAKCNKLAEVTKQAIRELNLGVEVQKVEDMQKIMSYGVMATPALVVNGQVKVSGRLPSVQEVKNWLR